MASLDLSIVNVAFPALERSFPHDSRATLAWVITGYSIVFGSLLVIAGRTADRLGQPTGVLRRAGACSPWVGAVRAGARRSSCWWPAGSSRGCGAAAMLPASLGLLLGAFPGERRSQVVALWGGIGALAVATGPSLGALLITGSAGGRPSSSTCPSGWSPGWSAGGSSTGSGPGATRATPDYLGVVL